ncbi:MAG: peroxidase family protein [Pseudomonadota bacterium]
MRITSLLALCIVVGATSAGCSSGSSSDAVDAATLAVDAGANKTVDEGDSVTLDDAAATPGATVEWTQVSGPTVTFSVTDTESPLVTAPRLRETTDAVLRMTATADGASVADEFTLTIVNTGNGPEGPSSQGINDLDRNARRNRDGNGGRTVGAREVRSFDGTGNNIDQPDWGSSFSHLQRLSAVAYADGVSAFAGPDRASARVISNVVVSQAEGESLPNTRQHTDMVWQWGQFIDHDFGLTDGAEESVDIEVPVGDPFFDPAGTGTAVILFNRALFDPATGTDTDNPREQENEITSWIDGSMVYGSDDERALALREDAESPFLATSAGNLLPFNVEALTNAAGFVSDPTSLFLAGDVRANEQVGLATMHTLWVREHNRLVQTLIDDNYSTDAEVLYQQARRLVIAKIQKITYDEFLPVLLGDDALPAYSGYDSTINPTLYNEFSAAAFRFGHSLLNEQLLRLDAARAEIDSGHLALRDAFFSAPSILTDEDSLDPVLRGLATQVHQSIDPFIVQDLRNFLFGQPGDGGLDLAALNIQRGRDHGVGTYNDLRIAMGLARYTSFAQITSDTAVQLALIEAYDGDIDAIDLWVGGLAEDAVAGSQFGPLFQAILVRQFVELRDGDRFWYERYLTARELDQIEATTLARVIRANTGIGGELQDDVFTAP